MNATQKKYTINRLIAIAADKAHALKVEDTEASNHYHNMGDVTVADVVAAHKSGKLKLKSSAALLTASSVTMDNIFDLSGLKKTAAKRIERLEAPDGAYTSRKGQLDRIFLQFESSVARYAKLEASLSEACDKVMLGSDAEALEAIQLMTDAKF